MKKNFIAVTALVLALAGMSVTAAETTTEAATEAATEAVERNYSPEEGTGWLVVEINGTPVEFEFTGSTKGMAGQAYSFEADEYTMTLMLNKALKVGEEMDGNAITQIEIVSSETSSVGYYFIKKSPSKKVDSKVTLAENENEKVTQAGFSAVVPTAERYVGDNKPGILPQLELTEGEFCFCEK